MKNLTKENDTNKQRKLLSNLVTQVLSKVHIF